MNTINTKSNIKSIKFSVTKMIMEYFGDLFNKHSSFAGDFQLLCRVPIIWATRHIYVGILNKAFENLFDRFRSIWNDAYFQSWTHLAFSFSY